MSILYTEAKLCVATLAQTEYKYISKKRYNISSLNILSKLKNAIFLKTQIVYVQSHSTTNLL